MVQRITPTLLKCEGVIVEGDVDIPEKLFPDIETIIKSVKGTVGYVLKGDVYVTKRGYKLRVHAPGAIGIIKEVIWEFEQ